LRWNAPKIGEKEKKMKKEKNNGVTMLPSQLRFGSNNTGSAQSQVYGGVILPSLSA
jgi:hypothetical protein